MLGGDYRHARVLDQLQLMLERSLADAVSIAGIASNLVPDKVDPAVGSFGSIELSDDLSISGARKDHEARNIVTVEVRLGVDFPIAVALILVERLGNRYHRSIAVTVWGRK